MIACLDTGQHEDSWCLTDSTQHAESTDSVTTSADGHMQVHTTSRWRSRGTFRFAGHRTNEDDRAKLLTARENAIADTPVLRSQLSLNVKSGTDPLYTCDVSVTVYCPVTVID
jgi:hypothetical protein